MATWRDGPEYAPVERPDAYTTPDAEPLGSPPASMPAPPSPPPGRPVDFGAPAESIPLAQLAAPPAAPRDPHEEFDTYTTPLTSLAPTPALQDKPVPPPQEKPAPPPPPAPPTGMHSGMHQSAWGSVHNPAAPRPAAQWAPAQPITLPQPPTATAPIPPPQFPPPTLNQSPFPTSAAWYPPPKRPAPRRDANMREIFSAMTPGVTISLAVGFFVPPLSVPLLIVAHILSGRMRYGRSQAHGIFIAVESLIALLTGILVYYDYGFWDPLMWWESANELAPAFNLLLLLALTATVGSAIRRGHPPDM